ncbi:MAG: type V CRISPR-associated protein Cas4 [Lachnospiraceae bacterium]|nr:type V CRISPR-associated protein Cas4 [Lachnospiraceae bacterium]
MNDYIAISTLNDFIFCPYSIYLHNVYMETDETIYHATPQTRGRSVHETVEKKTASNRADDILALPVYSEEFGLMGKIDVYKRTERKLIERKYQLKQVYQGQIYQLWAQMLCLKEMGYEVAELAFYEISTNRMIPVKMPDDADLEQFRGFMRRFREYSPAETQFAINQNKCHHCIYCSLCDKTTEDNVYQ